MAQILRNEAKVESVRLTISEPDGNGLERGEATRRSTLVWTYTATAAPETLLTSPILKVHMEIASTPRFSRTRRTGTLSPYQYPSSMRYGGKSGDPGYYSYSSKSGTIEVYNAQSESETNLNVDDWQSIDIIRYSLFYSKNYV